MKKVIKLAALTLAGILCVSWEDHPDTSHPTDSSYDRDCETNGWHQEPDTSHDTSESAAEHQGTCTGVPDRDH